MSLAEICPPEHFKGKKTIRSFELLEEYPPELRECVHEFGLPIVRVLTDAGIRSPNKIRQVVHEIWEGARQTTQRKRNAVRGSLDWLLIQVGAEISAATLIQVLRSHSVVIVPIEPTPAMVEASIDAVNHMGRVTKSTKHRNRLRAAIKAGALGGD